MTDAKYFTTTKKGEIFELKSELNSDKKEKKREAVKKVIASMTVGKDVSALFPDVVNCMQTDNLELKKLVYLYLMNYAKSQPDMAIMAVNTFVKDCEDPNPLIRALAVRTMGCIRVDKITEYLCEPLRKCLKDEDPYVRKTAAVCVAKLHDINAQLVEDQGFLDQLRDLLSDSNPMVVANAVAALSEINETSSSGQPLIDMNAQTINKLLTALNECTEWGQVFILDSLSNYTPKDEREAQRYRYATEVDVDFVRKAVRAIGRCAIKVEQSAERCVSTLLDLIQTKVNYVVQEAIVVIKDIFRKYPNKYESIISTLCENLDTLDEPEARASMIWIIGEYAERIDNADELLESFLEGFHDENTQVQLQLLTAIVKLFLKRPTETQELVQQVLSLATQDSDNPDLRDRGFIYWRLLSTDPAAAKEVVLAEKPLISEETDLLEPTLLDELICHIGSLASVYHKPPSAFVEGRAGIRKSLPPRQNSVGSVEELSTGSPAAVAAATTAAPASGTEQSTVIPSADNLIGDLLSIDIAAPPTHQIAQPYSQPVTNTAAMDLLGGGLDSLLGDTGIGVPGTAAASNTTTAPPVPAAPAPPTNTAGILGDIFGIGNVSPFFTPPKQVWLPAARGKGLEITGTFSRHNGQITMEMTVNNKAMQAMSSFAIQFNKNSFGFAPAQPLQVPSPLQPNSSVETSLPINTMGPIQKMDPLTNLQVAVKNNVDVFYFSCLIPMHVVCTEDGLMDKRVFLATWKDIPAQNEVQYNIENIPLSADQISQKLQNNNIFTIAKRNVEGQDMLYQSLKLTNGIWVLAELKIQPGNPNFTLSLKSRAMDVCAGIHQSYEMLLRS
ncbi:AP-1 complex subunit beta-1-like [Centruroides sculpturatus]|uniref:AP-1 complex subunit beta-1-like n=1 Tax=Centruroides sculpturatus TaxID=218467 RepID=UPI000C6DC4DC|nr:AP-1 complex subunit beta-1-like [Centruroides sculpturatus]